MEDKFLVRQLPREVPKKCSKFNRNETKRPSKMYSNDLIDRGEQSIAMIKGGMEKGKKTPF